MAENSAIEWTTHTFNAWRGCTKVAAGCANCYADTLSKRNPGTLGIWGYNGTRVVARESMWQQPLKWHWDAEAAYDRWNASGRDKGLPPERPRVFCASLSDWAEDWGRELVNSKGRKIYTRDFEWFTAAQHPHLFLISDFPLLTLDDVRHRLFALIDATPNLDWLLLTKRPENILRMWPTPGKFRRNVWLGTSIANQDDANRNIPHLLKCRGLAPVLFLSAEPLLGPVDLSAFLNCTCDQNGHCDLCIDGSFKRWVIVGGESGPHARPMPPAWARSLRDQCQAAGVPFMFKQWGEWIRWADCPHDLLNAPRKEISIPGEAYEVWMKVGKKAAGRTLDGVIHDGYPKVKHA